jgi:hypothetical protein
METLEQYLKQATQTVYGPKRREVIAELRGNILTLANEYELHGHSATQALALALADFGPARQLAPQFARVHTWPKLGRSLVLATIATMSLLSWSSKAEVQLTSLGPIPNCPTSGSSPQLCLLKKQSWVAYEQLQQELLAAGVGFSSHSAPIHFMLGSTTTALPINSFSITFPNDRPIHFSHISTGGFSLYGHTPSGQSSSGVMPYEQVLNDLIPQLLVFQRNGKHYINASSIIDTIARGSQLPVWLHGATHHRLQVGNTYLPLIYDDKQSFFSPHLAEIIYSMAMSDYRKTAKNGNMLTWNGSAYRYPSQNQPYQHALKLKPNTLYAVQHGSSAGLMYEVLPSDEEGNLTFSSSWQSLRFTRDLVALSQAANKPVVAIAELTGALNNQALAKKPGMYVVVPRPSKGKL